MPARVCVGSRWQNLVLCNSKYVNEELGNDLGRWAQIRGAFGIYAFGKSNPEVVEATKYGE